MKERKITISVEEFRGFITTEVRLENLKNFLENSKGYVTADDIRAILGIEVKNDNGND